jgi:ribA/ribD-fused uncharacterized protein
MVTEIIDFYSGPFSNFALSPFLAADEWERLHTYPTCEHYFAAWKAANQNGHDWVLAAPYPGGAKARGHRIQLRDDWESIKFDVMVEGLRQKFTLAEFRTQLLTTGDALLREDSPTDFVWGYRNNGLNLLGKALMQVRHEIRNGLTSAKTNRK